MTGGSCGPAFRCGRPPGHGVGNTDRPSPRASFTAGGTTGPVSVRHAPVPSRHLDCGCRDLTATPMCTLCGMSGGSSRVVPTVPGPPRRRVGRHGIWSSVLTATGGRVGVPPGSRWTSGHPLPLRPAPCHPEEVKTRGGPSVPGSRFVCRPFPPRIRSRFDGCLDVGFSTPVRRYRGSQVRESRRPVCPWGSTDERVGGDGGGGSWSGLRGE